MYSVSQDHQVEIINNNAPLKALSIKEKKRKLKPWITPFILISIKTKNIYYKKFIKTKTKFQYSRYRYYRDKLNGLISKSKKKHLHKYFQENYNDSKKTWQKINEPLHQRKKQKENLFLNEKGSLITDPKTVANKFNNFFINVTKNLLKDMGEKQTTNIRTT